MLTIPLDDFAPLGGMVGLGGLALAAADLSHGRQAPLLDLWRLSTPQIHPTKLAFKRGL